jgi:Cu-Zn family superoxide dismutase
VLAPPPGTANGITGTVQFVEQAGHVVIRVKVSGLAPNSVHGFHVHERGDLTQGCVSAGGHFNPFGKQHGGPQDEERHAGDLGNVIADASGSVDATLVDTVLALSGQGSVLGRSVVLHADADDLGAGGFPDSKTTGHAGARVACGVIGLAADVEL